LSVVLMVPVVPVAIAEVSVELMVPLMAVSVVLVVDDIAVSVVAVVSVVLIVSSFLQPKAKSVRATRAIMTVRVFFIEFSSC
jgi:hypothetical protein